MTRHRQITIIRFQSPAPSGKGCIYIDKHLVVFRAPSNLASGALLRALSPDSAAKRLDLDLAGTTLSSAVPAPAPAADVTAEMPTGAVHISSSPVRSDLGFTFNVLGFGFRVALLPVPSAQLPLRQPCL